jgi:homoserine kinase type II
VRPFLSADQNALIAAELKFQSGLAKVRLPRGAIHGDFFCDNVLFEGARVSGVIDFGFAATDAYIYDLAIAVNDWCLHAGADRSGRLDPGRVEAMTAAYTAIRPVSAEERSMWAPLLRAGALRFWLSRLYDLHRPRPGEITSAHDPADFERILRDRIASPPLLPG